jgi:protein SCO1/2
MSRPKQQLTGIVLLMLLPVLAWAQEVTPAAAISYDAEQSLERSQSAIGNKLGSYRLLDRDGRSVKLSDYAGKPLLISLIYTACYHTCPVTTRHLAQAVQAAREVLDEDSFKVVTIGFDPSNDSPESMRVFAREQGVRATGWDFLSGPETSIQELVDDLGFVYFPSPRGYDHIVQVTVVDRQGVVYQQVYGEMFELPWLVEPLKDLVFNRPESAGHPLSGLLDRVRLFCTVYDPTTGRYELDWSLFIQIAIGLIIVLWVSIYLILETRRARHKAQQ